MAGNYRWSDDGVNVIILLRARVDARAIGATTMGDMVLHSKSKTTAQLVSEFEFFGGTVKKVRRGRRAIRPSKMRLLVRGEATQ